MHAKNASSNPDPCAEPMATVSWSDVPSRREDVAEVGAVGNPFTVPEAHAGMMVTPSVKLVRPLGEGGMGSVWVADHLALHTQVVVKFIASSLKDSKDATERFSREAAAAAQVRSPHVVQTFDHGFTADGVPYIVMELLVGRDLGDFIDKEGKASPELVVEIIAQLARALDRAHERGIVHRDIKPGNIFLCDGGGGDVFVKLLDFGIAKGVDVPQLDSGTKTGAMIGSPFYMSPEQILGSKNIDHRSDLWSVGVVAFEALTGQKPFDAETMGGLAIRIHSEPLPLVTKLVPGLSPAVDAWFQRACSRPVPDRFNTAKEMAEALAAALGGQMPRSVGVPKSSTGSNRHDPMVHEPTLATTDAGLSALSRSTPPNNATRNRLLALGGVGAVLAFSAFFGVSYLKKGTTTTSSDGKALSSEPAPLPPPSALSVVVPPPNPPTSLSPIPPPPPEPAAAPVPPSPVAKPGHRPKPPTSSASPVTHPPLPSPSPTPAPGPAPASTRDIF
jgi:serine/threonine-protein kinase